MRSYEDLDARNGMNRAPRSSRDLTARSFENQLMGNWENLSSPALLEFYKNKLLDPLHLPHFLNSKYLILATVKSI